MTTHLFPKVLGAGLQIVKIRPGASDAVIPAEVVSPGVVKFSSRQR